MIEIPLSQGKFALVDDDEQVQWKWSAYQDKYTFYATRHVLHPVTGRRTTIRMHRAIMGVTDPRIQVDHIDLNGLNNQRHNLRIATHGQNQQNHRVRQDNTSGYKGVSWNRESSKWAAYIIDGHKIHLGYFTDPEEAARVYDRAAILHFGEFARLNFEEIHESEQASGE